MSKHKIILMLFLFFTSILASCDNTTKPIKLVINPSNYNYGNIDFGQTESKNFTITNNYTGAVTISMTRLTGLDANRFEITAGGVSNTIITANGGTHIITVEFTASSGTSNCELEVYFTAPDNTTKVIKAKLSGTGVAKALFSINATGSPPTFNFGQVNRGDYIDINGIISNLGSLSLNITNISIVGVGFSIVSGWTGSIITISAGSTHILVLRFSPIASGLVNGSLTIHHSADNVANPYVVSLVGESRGYGVETFPIGMTPMTTGTQVFLRDDDFTDPPVPIGFTFNFFGHNYSQVYISSNGYIGFGPNTTNYDLWYRGPYPRNNTYNIANIICVFAADTDPEHHGTVKYLTSGTAPNRIFTVEYYEISRFTFANVYITGQIKLYETSNIIELLYPVDIANQWITTGAGIGIQNADCTQGRDFDGVATSPTTVAPTQNLRYSP